ncbi:MAG: HD domain-containing phosphohydrolase [Omnitrophica WOR_2 bacterium]
MKINTKILFITLPLVLFAVLTVGGITYYFTRTAIGRLAEKWLELQLPEAVERVEAVRAAHNSLASPGFSGPQAQVEAIEVLQNIKVGENGMAFAVNSNGTIVTHFDPELVGAGTSQMPWIQQVIQNGKSGGRLTITLNSQKYLAIYSYYAPWDWYIFVADPESDVYRMVTEAGYSALLFALVSSLGVGVLLMMMTRRLLAPLSLLESGAMQVGRGNLDIRIPITTKDEIGNLAGVFNQMASQWQASLTALKKSEESFRSLIENSSDVLHVINSEGTITYCSFSVMRVLGYLPEEMVDRLFIEFIHPEDESLTKNSFIYQIKKGGKAPPIEVRVRHKDGHWEYMEATGSNLLDDPAVKGIVITSREIRERKEAVKLQESIYRISEAAQKTLSLFELFKAMHAIISTLMPAENFYVALYNENTGLFEFPFYLDAYDQPPEPQVPGNGLTEYVFRTGEPQLVSPSVFEELVITGKVDLVGAPSIDWLGVPLRTSGRTIGVLVVQSYTEDVRFGEKEKEILNFVSEQCAMAIARRQAEEATRVNETRYRNLFENSPISLWEEDFSEMKRYIDDLRSKGISDFKTFFLSHPDLVAECTSHLRVIDVNQATLKLYAAHSKEELIVNLDQVIGKDSIDIVRGELIAIALGRKEYEGAGVNYRLDGTPVDIVIRWSISPAYEETYSRVIVSILDVSERKRAEEEANNQLQRLNALRAIDTSITGSMDLKATLNVLLDQVTNQLEVDAAAILLLDPHILTLEYAAGRGFRTGALQHTHLRMGEGYAGRAALERRLIWNLNLLSSPGDLSSSPLLVKEGFIVYYAVPLIAKGQVKGVLEIFHRSPLNPSQEWLDFMETLGGQAAIAIDNASLFNDLQRSNIELTLAYDATIEGWSRALDLRDKETEGHTQRVTEMTLRLAELIGVNRSSIVHLRWGALLHDIGKMGIPDSILLKPGPLTDEEREIMYRHPVYAYEMLHPIPYLHQAIDIPYYHHEKWDGSGYPARMHEDQIPLAARIFSVVDVWDALRSNRPYRPAWANDKAIAYIREQSGKHFDPLIVEAFLDMIGPSGQKDSYYMMSEEKPLAGGI